MKFRKILSKEKICLHNNKGLRKQLKLSTLTQPLEPRKRNLYNLFRCGFFTKEFSEFLFKFNTGTLYTNAMISNFDVDQDPACSRCTGGQVLPAPKETLSHIFFDCPMIANIPSELNNLISNNTLDLVELTNVVWLGMPEKNIYCTFKTSLATKFFLYKSRNSSGMSTISKYKAFLAYTLPAEFYGILND